MRLEPWVRCAKKIVPTGKGHKSAVPVVSSQIQMRVCDYSPGGHLTFSAKCNMRLIKEIQYN